MSLNHGRTTRSGAVSGGLRTDSSRLQQENAIAGNNGYGNSNLRKRPASPSSYGYPRKMMNMESHAGHSFEIVDNCIEDEVGTFPYIIDTSFEQVVNEGIDRKMTRLSMKSVNSASSTGRTTILNEYEANVKDYIGALRNLLTQSRERLSKGQVWICDAATYKVNFFNRIQVLQGQLETLQQEAELKTTELNTAKEMVQKLQRIASDARSSLNSVQSRLVEKDSVHTSVEGRYKDLEAKFLAVQTRLTQSELQFENSQERLRREEERNEELKHKLTAKGKEMTEVLTETRVSTSRLQDRIHALQDQIQSANGEHNRLSQELADARVRLSEAQHELAHHRRGEAEATQTSQSLSSEREELRSRALLLQTRLETLEKEHERVCADAERVRVEYQQSASQLASERGTKEFESQLRTEAQAAAAAATASCESLRAELSAATAELNTLRHEVAGERERAATAREELKDQHASEKDAMSTQMRDMAESLRRERAEAEERLVGDKLKLETRVKLLEEEVKCARESREQMFREFSSKESELERATMELAALRKVAGKADSSVLEDNCALDIENQKLKKMLELRAGEAKECGALESMVEDLKAQVLKGEVERRRMHNQIQELKGNIRVMCRVRPMMECDGEDEAEANTVEVMPDATALTIRCQDKNTNFNFDHVFGPSAGQAEVFGEVQALVQSALDGYSVCLFSYGQTGSGKTWTMSGGRSEDDAGIIRRSVAKVLQDISVYRAQGWEYELEGSFCEIYNEKLIDLVGESSEPLDIKQEPVTKRTFVPGLSRHTIATMRDLERLADRAGSNRSTAATDMNARSSRSHCVFTLHIRGSNAKLGTNVEGSLHLCDLAGSERVQRTHAEGERFAEAIAINGSLSSLTTMFRQLASGGVASFRDSKLTYLLKDCFTGQGKTLMFVNLSPTAASAHESQCSLRFASTVSQVHMGTAKKNVSRSDGPTSTTRPATAGSQPGYMKSRAPTAGTRPGTAGGVGRAATSRLTRK